MVAALAAPPTRSKVRPHCGTASSRPYERRRPEKTPLHKIVSENLESWLEWREAQTAAHLADHVIPPLPVRQWVISVPKRLRGMLADRPAAVAALTRIFLDEIERLLCAAAGVTRDATTPSASRPRLGGISFLHRFGSALNNHVHLHACVTDGVFVPAADQAGGDAAPEFLPARPVIAADLAALTERVRRRVIRWFRLARLLDAAAAGGHVAGGQPTEGCCDTQAKPRSHDTSRIAWAKLMARVGEEFPLECPACGGDIRLISFITEPGPIRKILTHLGEPLQPPPISPARGPPTDWGELMQIHDDRDIFQGRIDELPAIDIHSL